MTHIYDVIEGGIRQIGGGGFLMIPLLFCSLFAHAIILERFYNLRRSKLMPRRFISRIYKILEKGDPDVAIALCDSRPGPLTSLIRVGIVNRHLAKDDLWVVLNTNAQVEKLRLRKYMSTLSFLAGLAVIIGLLGTVVGMFVSFSAVWRTDKPDTSMTVARGISYALITTAAGLLVALPALVGHAYFTAKIDGMIDEMTKHSFSLVRFFTTSFDES